MTDVPLSSISCGSPTPRPSQRSIALEPLALASRTDRQPAPQPSSISGSDEPCSPPAPPRATIPFHNTTNRKESSWTPIIPPSSAPSPCVNPPEVSRSPAFTMRCSPVASSPSWETSKPRWPTTYASRSACSMPPTPAAPSPYLSPAPAEACDRVLRSMTPCASHRAPSAPSVWNSPRPWAP